jgi:hypothetical protein
MHGVVLRGQHVPTRLRLPCDIIRTKLLLRALDGVPPTIDLTLGYNQANSSPFAPPAFGSIR